MRSCRRIKIYGERNTNTKFMRKLIDLNLDVEQLPGVVPPALRRALRLVPRRANELIRDLYFVLTFRQNLGWKHSLVRSPADLDR